MYTLAKHLHLTAIAISVLFFIVRFIWKMRSSPLAAQKWVKITPHVIDTVLLGSAIWLCVILSQYPFTTPWLTEKVVGLVCYILMGLWAMKWARTNTMRWLGFAGALAWIVFLAKVAVTKQPLLFG